MCEWVSCWSFLANSVSAYFYIVFLLSALFFSHSLISPSFHLLSLSLTHARAGSRSSTGPATGAHGRGRVLRECHSRDHADKNPLHPETTSFDMVSFHRFRTSHTHTLTVTVPRTLIHLHTHTHNHHTRTYTTHAHTHTNRAPWLLSIRHRCGRPCRWRRYVGVRACACV